ncbi:MAG: ABC transporter permease [Actinobacteria bacterium]|nr:ABC transporter permease [Actinomycetota bacterium]
MSDEGFDRDPAEGESGGRLLDGKPTNGEEDRGRPASLWRDAWRQLRKSPMFIISSLLIIVFLVMSFFPTLFTHADPYACDLAHSLEGPSAQHIFGYDLQGCDYYARTIYGARISIFIGVVVTAAAVVIAVVLGSIAGFYGKALDAIIARVTDVWFAIPFILGAIVVLSLLGSKGFFEVALVLTILGWPTMLRLLRSTVLSVKEQDYVDAARALGASDFRIITRHILPNAIAPVIVYATITVGAVIAAEASLSFLGVGIQLPAISWGLMITVAQNYILEHPYLLLFPGAFLSAAVFSFILMGDALRDAIDPKLR